MDRIYTEIEVTASMARNLIGSVIKASIKDADEGYYYTAMSQIEEARKLLPALEDEDRIAALEDEDRIAFYAANLDKLMAATKLKEAARKGR